MGDRELIAFLALMGVTVSFAVDAILPAFDDMKESLGLAQDSNRIALSITVYFIAMSSSQIVYGPLADRFGRKPVLYGGLLIYISGAVVSSLSGSLTMLLVGRAIWGVGASALRVLSNTIVRDLFRGDRMASILSLVMAVFLIGPVLAPLIGEGILVVAAWQAVLASCAALAIATALWSRRLPETLDPADRRPLRFTETRDAITAVVSSRTALGYSLTMMFIFGILASFLASSQLIIDEIYGRADQYAILFSLLSIGSGIAAFTNSLIVENFGAKRIVRYTTIAFVLTCAALAIISLAGNGTPNFWAWFAVMTIVMALLPVVISTGNALAMEPLGNIAGTASGVIGTISAGGGSILGATVDFQLSDSVTPMGVNFVIFSALGLAAAIWAETDPIHQDI